MTWDSAALTVIAAIWIALGFVYAYGIGMMPGARAWWSGGVVLAATLLALLIAERRRAAGAERITGEAATASSEA